VQWVRTYGNAVSTALFDPACARFTTRGVDGAIAYKMGWGCAVAIGDPICSPDDHITLARAFQSAAGKRGLATVFAVTSEPFAQTMASYGAAAVGFGKELILDPERDPSKGSKGRELRKKLIYAQKAGLRAGEYDRANFANGMVERELEQLARAWLDNRRGPQIFLTGVRLFEAPDVTRYFHVRDGDRYVGLLTTLRLDSRDGYLLNHILTTPDAPDGTSELLIAHTLSTLGREGCRFATFGPAPECEIGGVMNLPAWSERIARKVFAECSEAFHLDARTRYRRKFQVAREEPSYLVFDPPRIGPKQIGGVLRAFNVSLA
jgi:lysylphosphatidylglycerol synthetase-like protein (DUF2156 family)